MDTTTPEWQTSRAYEYKFARVGEYRGSALVGVRDKRT
jgi:hypothetical protein